MKHLFAIVMTLALAAVFVSWRLEAVDAQVVTPPCGTPVWTPSPGAQINAGPMASEITHLETCAAQYTQQTAIFNARAYGALCDNNTDDTVAIQNTVNAAGANGGGIVYLPGLCVVSATISNGFNNVKLEGCGTNTVHTVGTAIPIQCGLKWKGLAGGPTYQIGPSPSASAQALVGDDVKDVEFTGNNLETGHIQVLSVWFSRFENIFLDSRATSRAMEFNGVNTIGDNGGDLANVLININCSSPGFNDPTGASCFYFGGGAGGGNYNQNTAINLKCLIKKATCLNFSNADNDYFFNVYCFMASGGTGLGIDLQSGVNSVVFDGVEGSGSNACPMLAETGSYHNQLQNLDNSNNIPPPTIQPSADVNYTYNGDESMQFSCASVASTGTTCTFPGSFGFHGTTYQCTYGTEGSTATVSVSAKTLTSFTATASTGTIGTVNFNCWLRKTS